MDCLILIPILNDWPALGRLLPRLDEVLAAHGHRATVLVVDDGSPEGPEELPALPFPVGGIAGVSVLQLRRNLGHQRAIAVGLAYVEAELPRCPVIVMDGDGEDDPADVPRLLAEFVQAGARKVVFARRQRRRERLGFRLGYAAYQVLFQALTGHRLRVGNFSVVPPELLPKLVVVSEIWNHYAAGLLKARVPYCEVPTDRGGRLSGRSHMNLVALVSHGLSAIAVFAETAGSRLFLLSLILMAFAGLGIAGVVVLRLFTPLAIPGWATSAAGLLLVLLLQGMMLGLFFAMAVLSARHTMGMIPSQSFRPFIDRITPWSSSERVG